MEEQWYYRMFGEEFGPMPLGKLKELVESGSITVDDEVRRDHSSEWVLANTVKELGLGDPDVDGEVDLDEFWGATVEVHPEKGRDEWFCLIGGQELGPLAFDEVGGYVEREQLSATDMVKLGADGKWRAVGSIGRLMALIPYQADEKHIESAEPHVAATGFEDDGVEAYADLSEFNLDSPTPAELTAGAAIQSEDQFADHEPTKNDAGLPAALKSYDQVGKSSAGPAPSPIARPTDSPAGINSSGMASSPRPETLSPLEEPYDPMSDLLMPATRPTEVASVAPRPPVYSPATFDDAAPFKPAQSGSGNFRTVTAPKKPAAGTAYRSGSSWLADALEQVKEPKALASVGVLLLIALVVGWNYLPKSKTQDIKYYRALKQILDDIRAHRSNPTEIAELQISATKTAKEIADALKNKASRDEPAKQYLLWAARDEFPRALQAGFSTESISERSFATRLQEAAYELGLERRPQIPVSSEQIAPVPDN